MQLTQILNELKWDETKAAMRQHFDDCSRKYFRAYQGSFPMPEFVIKTDAKKAGWFNGEYTSKYVPNTSLIGVNPDFLGDSEMFRGIMYHETIHYYQFHTYSFRQYKHAPNGGHDEQFIKDMERINAGEGKRLVTLKQETATIEKALTGKFWVYGIKTKSGEYAFAHTKRKNDKAVEFLTSIVNKGRYDDGYVFETDEYKYKIGSFGPKGFKFEFPNNQDVPDLSSYSVKSA